MKKKRMTTLILTLLIGVQTSFSIPADPQPKKVRQPDGTMITVRIGGDEHSHYLTGDDGTPLYYNSKTKDFEYARISSGVITGTGIKAKDSAERDAKSKACVAGIDMKAFENAIASARKSSLRRVQDVRKIRINNFPTIGRQKALVIIVQFSDVKFSAMDNPGQFYHDMLNKEGFTWSNGAQGSARDYYLASSQGQFDPDFTVAGPVTLSHPATYYGKDEGSEHDVHWGEAVKEACMAVDKDIDFSEFDADGDGYVDNIYFFYAGGGQADDPRGTDYVWPHAAKLDQSWGIDLTLDGKKISRYACSNELRYNASGEKIATGIGTFVHEFGHVLGLPDLYDVTYNQFTFGLGYWDAMAQGSYNNNMNTPPTFSAFERAELGWLNYTELTAMADTISLLPVLPDCNKAYRVSVDGTQNREFYVMENRRKRGWDKFLPGEGMLLWHIDIDEAAWKGNYVNIQPGHQRVDIVEADGTQSESSRAGDTFPGTSGVEQWQLKSWAGKDLLKLDDITDRNDTIRLLTAPSRFVMPAPEKVTVENVRDSSFTLTWSKTADAKKYFVSVYTTGSNGSKTFVPGLENKQFMTVDTIEVSDLLPSTSYTIEVAAGLGDYISSVTTAMAKTLDLAFAKRKAEKLTAKDITPTGFTAGWDAISGADDYKVTLFRHGYSTATTDFGYDFTGKYDGMPALWNTNSTAFYAVKGYYGKTAPSLRLSETGDYLIIAWPETKIDRLQMWLRSSKAGNKLLVERAEGGGWKTIGTIDAPTVAKTVSVETEGAEKIRLTLERTAGFTVIDDVVAACRTTERNAVEGYDGVNTGGQTQFTFNGLESGQTYSFRTQGVNGSELSYLSDECAVTLPKPVRNDTLTIGYCNHTAATTTDIQTNGKTWTEAALRVPAEALAAYPGNGIVAVNAALVARINTDTLKVWVRKDLNGENLAEGTVVRNATEGIVKGWNTVRFDKPYTITADEGDLYIGYSLHQKANVGAVSVVDPPMPNTSYLKLGTAAWKNISDDGVLSIEAVVAGPDVPGYDLGVNSATVSPAPSEGAGALRVEAMVHNYGARDIDGFTLAASAPGTDVFTAHFDRKIPSTGSATVSYTILPDIDTDEHTVWTVGLQSLDNAADERAANNSATATYTFLRNVLLEEFTTERCVNCPRVAGFIHELTAKAEYKDRVTVVTHHAGFYTDKFTQPCDEELLWLYKESVYAPAVLMDRRPYFKANGKNNVSSLAFLPESMEQLAGYVDYELAVKANAVLGITNELNADSTVLTTTVTCLKNANYTTEAPRVAVNLLENDIATTTQSGADGVYMQQHVTRAYNSTWGDAVEWNGNTATLTYTFNLDKAWNRKNMEVVAYLYNYDSTDHLNCVVDNSASAPLLKVLSGITTPAAAPLHEIARYRLDGSRATSADKGIVLVRMSDGTVKKIVVK